MATTLLASAAYMTTAADTGESSGSGTAPAAVACTAKTSNVGDVYSYLSSHLVIQKGRSDVNRAARDGFIGNWQAESDACLSVWASGDNNAAHGFAQWEGDRYAQLQTDASKWGGSWSDLGIEERFAVDEIEEDTGASGNVIEYLQNVTDPQEAARLIAKYYERCLNCDDDTSDTVKQRESNAQHISDTYKADGADARPPIGVIMADSREVYIPPIPLGATAVRLVLV